MSDVESLHQRIKALNDEELLRMVKVDYEQYRPEAIEYAVSEVERRGLTLWNSSAQKLSQDEFPEESEFSTAPPVIANAGKPRLLASFIDELFALVLALLILASIKPESPVFGGLLLCSSYLSYFLFSEFWWSRTLGKFSQGLEVRRLDGRRCDFKAAFIRTLARIIEVNPLLLGGLPAGIFIVASKRKQRFGDLLAGTLVMSSREARELWPERHAG